MLLEVLSDQRFNLGDAQGIVFVSFAGCPSTSGVEGVPWRPRVCTRPPDRHHVCQIHSTLSSSKSVETDSEDNLPQLAASRFERQEICIQNQRYPASKPPRERFSRAHLIAQIVLALAPRRFLRPESADRPCPHKSAYFSDKWADRRQSRQCKKWHTRLRRKTLEPLKADVGPAPSSCGRLIVPQSPDWSGRKQMAAALRGPTREIGGSRRSSASEISVRSFFRSEADKPSTLTRSSAGSAFNNARRAS